MSAKTYIYDILYNNDEMILLDMKLAYLIRQRDAQEFGLFQGSQKF